MEDSTKTVQIAMDDEHNHLVDFNAEDRSYVITPCGVLVVDPSGYMMQVPPKAGVTGPNAVHLYQGKSENKYRAAWTPGKLSLGATTLKWLAGEKKFGGFRLGQTYILAIGHDNFPPPSASQFHFQPMWVTQLHISAEV